MDKGAHFHKCDFQVHTPRDANWEGGRAASEAERKEYAAELIQACRGRGLKAIAITDHHDFAFFPYVRAAAAAEVDQNGNPISPENRVVVFPGVELTLSSPPCQAILILSSDFEAEKLDDILTTLAIDITPPSDSKLQSVEHVSPTSVTSLSDLEDKLNLHRWLKGKFIILPNVTDGGHKTLFRDGFDKHYKEMRCVGGYLDGSYSRTSIGKRNILEGRQQNNGYQPIAVLQTSDNRRRDHIDLGEHITWVKWAEPTAEALRQACLAKESRLSLTDPELPRLWITSVTVSNSKFMGHVDLELSQQYTAIIGGRGTGKSTILEYLRWGLCDESIGAEDLDSVQGKRRNLIDNTLLSFDGDVHVTFILNAVKHIVKRNSKKREILLKIGDGDFTPATEAQVRTLLPIQAYSQKQLSSVAVRIEELRRFVEVPIRQALDQLRSEAKDIEAKARAAYGDLTRKRQLDNEIEKNELEIQSLTRQAESLRKGLSGLSEEDQKTIDQKPLYDNEVEIVDGLTNRLSHARDLVQSLTKGFSQSISGETIAPDLQNPELIAAVREAFVEKFDALQVAISTLTALCADDPASDLSETLATWRMAKDRFDERYAASTEAAASNRQQLDQIQTTEERNSNLKKQQTERRAAVSSLGESESQYASLRSQWEQLNSQRREALKKQCDQFTGLSNGLIKAEIASSLDVASLQQKLRSAFAGMNVREDKIEKICLSIATNSDSVKAWNSVLLELESLALHDPKSGTPGPTPILTQAGIIETERGRIAAQLSPTKWMDLAFSPVEFNPQFTYCTNKETAEYIEFADASAGQQATALLTVLLNQPGAPLIIDQPEDDIDSKMIREIVEQVWKAKWRRQLIFASHSANFVVNGDAELVVCCDYLKAGDQTQGRVKTEGAIDIETVRKEITLVTEGGEKAFKLRKEKYGF